MFCLLDELMVNAVDDSGYCDECDHPLYQLRPICTEVPSNRQAVAANNTTI